MSVALATYNGAAYVEAQLRSLADQTRPPDELVVTDDGSSDGTVALVEAFAETAPFAVRISVNQRRLGYTHNFGEALRRCRGDVVFLCDQDDVWYPKKIERILEFLGENPAVHLVIHDRRVTNHDLTHSGVTELGNFRRIGLPDDGFVSGCCTAVRRPFLGAVLPIPDVAHGHDSWMHLLARLLGVRYVLPETLIDYRRHGANVSETETVSVARVNGLRSRLRARARKIRRALIRSHTGAVTETEAEWRRCADRLAALRDEPGSLPGVSPAALENAEVRARAMVVACQARVQAVALPRWRRAPRVFASIVAGYYRGFDLPGALLLDLFAASGEVGSTKLEP